MKAEVRGWFKDKLGKKRKPPARQGEPVEDLPEEQLAQLPRLPSVRPHTLTPSPSQEDLTSSSRLLTLPRELREEILILAFGDQIVHMDLSFCHPIAPGDNAIFNHARINSDVHTTPPRVIWDLSVPKSWQWWSCVCHRPMPNHLRTRIDRYKDAEGPGSDYCRQGMALKCDHWPGVRRFKCKIGAMGWLLTCRQAYMEGIGVLYRTNTIHLSGTALSLHIPQLLLPQRLSDISSLEIVWPLKLHNERGSRAISADDYIEPLPAILSKFPNLARLQLALKTDQRVSDQVDFQRLLEPLDALVRRFKPTLDQFAVSLPRSMFAQLYEPTRDRRLAELGVQRLPYLSTEIWRNVDGTYVLIRVFPGDQKPFSKWMFSSYPKSPQHTSGADGQDVGDGYWIVQGVVDDEPPYYMCTMP